MFWWWWLGCGGGLAPDECREAGDCPDGQACLSPGYVLPCGYHDEGCLRTGCDAGQYCAELPMGSCVAAECRPRCADDAGCGEDEICDLPTGACLPRPCAAGYTCGPQTRCDETFGDPHDCLRLTCERDDDCDPGGWCVKGACYERPGSCGSDLAPP